MFGRFFIIILGESLQYSLHKYTLKCINFQNKKKDGFFVFFLRMEKKIKAKSAVFIGKKPRTVTLFIPGCLILISTVVISVGLFVFDWRMALASLWVVPVSLIIVLLSYKVQDMRESVRPRAIAYG